jgi:hypothetical protein
MPWVIPLGQPSLENHNRVGLGITFAFVAMAPLECRRLTVKLILAMHELKVSVCWRPYFPSRWLDILGGFNWFFSSYSWIEGQCALLCFCTLAIDLIFKLVFFQLLPPVHGVRVGVCYRTYLGTLAANLNLRLASIWIQLLSRSFFFWKHFMETDSQLCFEDIPDRFIAIFCFEDKSIKTIANFIMKTFHENR